MASDQDPDSTHRTDHYYDHLNEDEDTSGTTDLPLYIIIFAVAFHVLLIIIVCYFVCCRKERQTGNDRRPLNRLIEGPLARRHSLDVNATTPRRGDSNRSSNRSETLPTGTGNNLPEEQIAHEQADLEPRPVTNWQTSLLTRVRQQFDRLSRSRANPHPPPYFLGQDDPGDNGLTNPAIEVDEGSGLPSYHDYLQRLPPWHAAYETGCEEDKPPSYEEVVKDSSPR